MTADQYVASVVRKYAVSTVAGSPASKAASQLVPVLKKWAGRSLLEIQFSGSYAKGTAISLGTDVDLFISLDCGQPVKDIYWSLFQFCVDRGLRPQAQDVSVRVRSNGLNIDLVPGRLRGEDPRAGAPAPHKPAPHTLYRRKKDRRVQTDVVQHIKVVVNSGRADEIRAVKIWRERNHVAFPSFYLELTIIEVLKHNRSPSLAENVRTVLQYLADGFMQARVIDPANTNNVISDDLDLGEKRAVMNAARTALQRGWEQILW